jgi:lipopolysaccharide export system permease protein
MKIYQRYIFKELAKVFFLFLGSFYFLYILIDYAANMKNLHQEGLPLMEVGIYYLLQFASISEILIPVALLIASVKVATQAYIRNEIIALVASGVSYKKVLSPFLYCALFCTSLLYLNFEFITPLSASKLDTFKNVYLKGNDSKTPRLSHLQLNDGSLLLYGIYEPKRGAFSDAYWILGPDEIYRMKVLFPFAKTPRGKFVDHLVRDKNGDMKKKESFDTFSFPEMKFEEKALFEEVHPPEWQSLDALLKGLPSHPFSFALGKVNDREAKCKTILYHKLTIPLLSLLVCLGALPFCIQYRRAQPLFMIYALSLFGVICFFMLTSSCRILGESQVVAPLWAIFSPYLVCFTFFGFRYANV